MEEEGPKTRAVARGGGGKRKRRRRISLQKRELSEEEMAQVIYFHYAENPLVDGEGELQEALRAYRKLVISRKVRQYTRKSVFYTLLYLYILMDVLRENTLKSLIRAAEIFLLLVKYLYVGASDKKDDLRYCLRLAKILRADVHGIVEMASKIYLSSLEKATEKERRGLPEGYKTTRNPEEAVPRELAMPEDVFLSRLVTGFLAREKREKKEEKRRITLLLDKSGSMRDEKLVWSRSVALALYWKAKGLGVPFSLIMFDSAQHFVGSDELSILEALLKVEPGGGTDIPGALRAGEGDLIAITDCEQDVDEETLRSALEGKRLTTITILPTERRAEVLRRVSSDFYSTRMTEGEAIVLVRSLI